MGIGELLIIAGLLAGFVKFQIDIAEKSDKRIDNVEKEVIILSHKMDNYKNQSFSNLEVLEAKINMLIATQESFMEQVRSQVRKAEICRKE